MAATRRIHKKVRPEYSFLALDFESANRSRDSACALGLVKVVGNKITHNEAFLIRPPTGYFEFSYLHNITWEDVKNEPDFGELWLSIEHHFNNIDFIVAHNASFDRSVLYAYCDYHEIQFPRPVFLCTMNIARSLWNIYPTKLPDVCHHFKIGLKHHDALSHTLACAQIMLMAIKENRFRPF
jgi:DNA polymerase III subunit epsilon